MTPRELQADTTGRDSHHSVSTDASPAEAFPPTRDSDLDPITVLIADDNPTNRVMCRGVLSKKGFAVREAVDGCAALDEVSRHRPDVILLDVMMPNMDGLECTRRLKASAATRDIPIIIVSACTDASDIAAGLSAGADEYVGKPLRAAELEVRIRSVVRLYRNQNAALRTAEAEAVAKALQTELERRKRMETELREAKEAAESASRAKSDFLATMSHELRTPLNGVIGMTDLLLRTDLSSQQRRYATVAKHSGDTLLCLINDILDFSKIEAGKVELERVTFDLPDTIESVILTLEERAKAKGLTLDRSIHPQAPPRVVGDPGRIQQVLMNLIGNAIKFTDRGQIAVRAMVENQTRTFLQIRFTINDTGIGIPAERIEHLFRSFQQLDASTTRKYGGTGLGLAICRRLVELMGGTIGASSEPGLGSTFWFTVNLEYASNGESLDRPHPTDMRRVRVLVVDEDGTARDVLSSHFTDAGIAIEVAPDARAALTLLRDSASKGTPFAVAVLAMHLPDMNGLQLAESIKNDPLIQNVVLLLFSSGDAVYDEDELRRAGFSSWLQEPTSQSKLLDAMATALACATRPQSSARDQQESLVSTPKTDAGVSGVRVLLADDNQIGREVASATLSMLGCTFDVVCDGQAALDAIARTPYDLVFMDCQMPTMDGFEATRLIRRREAGGSVEAPSRRLPIVALTANAVKGDRERCLEAGMDDYLAKPFQADELAAMIKRLVLQQPSDSVQDQLPSIHSETNAENRSSHRDQKPDGTVEPFQYDALMARWAGNKEFVVNLVRMFQDQGPGLLAELQTHVDRADPAQVSHSAHGLKGAAAYVSAEAIRRLAAEIEEMGKAADLHKAADAMRSLHLELERCLAFEPGIFESNNLTPPPAPHLPVSDTLHSQSSVMVSPKESEHGQDPGCR